MGDHNLRSALFSKDNQSCYDIIDTNHKDNKLVNTIYEMLYAGASVKATGKQHNESTLHPICVINSIKNFIGDDKDNPSLKLMKFVIDYLQDFEFRKNDELRLQESFIKDVGQTVFVGEFEDACQKGNWEDAEILMFKIFSASDRSRSILDTLVDLALQNTPENVLFVYHLLRGFQFREEKNDSWVFIKCLYLQIKLNGIGKAHDSVEIIPDIIKKKVIQDGNIITFSAIQNIWNGDYVKIRSYRRELSYWLNEMKFDESIETNLIDNHFLANMDNKFYIGFAEKIINQKISISQKAAGLVTLEAIRSITKNIDDKSLRYIGSRFNYLVLS